MKDCKKNKQPLPKTGKLLDSNRSMCNIFVVGPTYESNQVQSIYNQIGLLLLKEVLKELHQMITTLILGP